MHIAWRILIGLIPACCYIAVVSNAHRRLKNEIEQKDREIKQLKYDLKSYECQIDTIMNVDNSIPEGCMQGPYCEACAFVKHYYVPSNQPGIGRRLLTLCGKGMACDCFVEKGEEK